MIRKRILQFINNKGITKYEFYKITKLSNGFLDKSGAIGSDKCEIICSYFPELNPEWLLTGKGPMLREQAEPNKPTPIPAKPTDSKSLPLLPVSAIAGLGSGELQVKETDIEQWYRLPDFPSADFLISISGDSMLPTYKSGDIAICKRIIHIYNIVWGRLYVIYSNDMGALFKRIYPADNDEYLILRSDNSQAYPDIKILKTDIVNISLVLGIIRKD